MGALIFGVLGPLEVRNQRGLLPLRGYRERSVLALLLLEEGRLLPLSRLVAAVWDGEPPRAAEKAVRNAVSALRGRFAQAEMSAVSIETEPAGYRLRLHGSSLDAAEFSQRTAAARELAFAGQLAEAVDELRAGLALWRGPALAGLSGIVIQAAAARLDEQRLAAWEECLELELRLGRHREVSGELQELAGEWPLRELLARLLMLALYRSGRQAEALDAFHRLAAKLAEDLGIDPSAEVTALHEAILRQDAVLDLEPAPGPVDPRLVAAGGRVQPPESPASDLRPAQLPLDVPGFAGRAAELAQLHGLLPAGAAAERGGTVVISAIGGTAGVGKTALAIRFAHQVAGRFPDGQLYVNLQGFGPAGPPVVPVAALGGLLQALGMAPEAIPADEPGQAALYRTLLAGRRVLVVLDNARDAGQVRPLLPASPGCLVIVTSRSDLTGLAVAEGARLLTLDMLDNGEAAELLAGRLGQDRLDREPGTAEKLASLCSGLPLALAIVAARAAARPALTLTDVVGELLNAQSRLDALDTGDPATSVRAVFSWSYQQLTEPAARMFRLTGLHPFRDFTVDSAASLAGVAPPEARRLLDELIRSHLLSEHAHGRYSFHDLLRAYSKDLADGLDAADDLHQALGRLFDHYLTTAAAAMDWLYPAEAHRRPRIGPAAAGFPGPQAALAWLDAERSNLVALTRCAAKQGWHSHVMQLAQTLDRYFQGGHYTDGLAMHNYGREAARRAGDRGGEAHALRAIGLMHMRLGQTRQASQCLEQALDLYSHAGDRIGQARTLGNLALTETHVGHYRTGVRHYEQALSLFRQAGDTDGETIALANLGDVLRRLGRIHEANDHLRQGLTQAQKDGNRDSAAYILTNLGEVSQHSGHLEQAAERYRQALEVFCELGNLMGQATTLANLGTVCTELGQPEQAAAHHREALAIFGAAHALWDKPLALNGLGEALHATGRHADALKQHEAALAVAGSTGHREELARAHAGLGRALDALGHSVRARQHFQDSLDLYAGLGNPEAEEQIQGRLRVLMSDARQ